MGQVIECGYRIGLVEDNGMIARITDAYVRHYRDSDDFKTYVEWVDDHGQTGRTESSAARDPFHWRAWPLSVYMFTGSEHMAALLARAGREGVPIRGETW